MEFAPSNGGIFQQECISMLRRCAVHAVLSLAVGTGLIAAPGAGATDFTDRNLLTETFTLDEQKPLADAQAALAAAEAELAASVVVRDAAQTGVDTATADLATAQLALDEAEAAIPPDLAAIDEAQAEVDAKQALLDQANADLVLAQADVDAKTSVRDESVAVVQAIEAEIAATAALVQQLSDKQVHALNSALNNAYKTDLLPLELDAAQLQRILDGNYGVREIHALTMAYEAEARFNGIADRFESRYEDTGREHFAARADAFEAKADVMAAKFEGKLERFEEQNAARDAREAAHDAAHEAGQEHGQGLAKGHDK
jgi:hypothetical protein